MFEVFIESIFAGALDRVTNERGAPTGEDAADTFGAANLPPRFEVALVEIGVDLSTAFDKVQRGDGRVSGALGPAVRSTP